MQLNASERFLIERRRKGLGRDAAGRPYKVNGRIYGAWENGQGDMPKAPSVTGLTAAERCLIMRRRSGKTQEQVAKELKCSRFWVRLMEKGRAPCDDLTWYWEQ